MALTLRAFAAKNATQDFQDGIQAMLDCPDSPSGRFTEGRFRDVLFTLAQANLGKDQTEIIFPVLSKEGSRQPSKDGGERNKSKRRMLSKRDSSKEAVASA